MKHDTKAGCKRRAKQWLRVAKIYLRPDRRAGAVRAARHCWHLAMRASR